MAWGIARTNLTSGSQWRSNTLTLHSHLIIPGENVNTNSTISLIWLGSDANLANEDSGTLETTKQAWT
jgi:hypothetical protein